MNLEILQRHEVPAEERTAMLNAAHAEVEELSDLVAEVVDLATDRYEEEPFTDVDLAEVCVVVVDRLHRRNGRHITSVVETSVVRGKRDALDRAITNVIANADTWTPDAGTIELIVAGGTVTVRDTGPGFADDDLPHVFERFYRSDLARAKPGSGLGLSIVDQIVMDHGGTVFARNRSDGRGAVVGFTIPAA
jgi:two-component system sensor histidine kinase MprB